MHSWLGIVQPPLRLAGRAIQSDYHATTHEADSRDERRLFKGAHPVTQTPRPTKLILETDGAARGNPGLAGAGIIIKDANEHRIEQQHKFLGRATNNQAEYQALIEGLQAVARYQPESVTIRMDSELVVRQMSGQYRVKNPDLLPLYLRALELVDTLPSVTFEYIPRERNPGADAMANLAIDARMVRGRGASE